MEGYLSWSWRISMKYYLVEKTYTGNKVRTAEKKEFCMPNENFPLFEGAAKAKIIHCSKGEAVEGLMQVSFNKSMIQAASISMQLEMEHHNRENFVFVPGAVYGGNRFESRKLAYPPYAEIPESKRLTYGPVITDIPRLSSENVRSKIQFRSGDMTTPALGYYDAKEKRGTVLLGHHMVNREYTGFQIEEDLEIEKLYFSISFPAVREESKYFFGERKDGSGFYPDNHAESDDRGISFEKNERFQLRYKIYSFPANDLNAFFTYFNNIRQTIETGYLNHTLPFASAYQEVKEKYQRENYHPQGYFTVGTDWSKPQQCFQSGWIGGGMNYYSFLFEGKDSTAYQRACHSFRFILDHLQKENGWIDGIYADGNHYGDNFKLDQEGSHLLVRKNADILYFLLKEIMVLETDTEGMEAYKVKIKKLADAFVRLFLKYGQIGQFIDCEAEEMLVGNSASAGIAVGALALAGEYYEDSTYIDTAKQLGELYYEQYVQTGILNGGPGEICQAPDSEAAFGLLEGYVQLYETTKEAKWCDYAKQTCEIALTWVMSYDFVFPVECTASRRRFRTMGTVFANAQNKHSAPGICTLSGNSLLKLYQMTKDEKYLKWLTYISHNLIQSVSVTNNLIDTLEKRNLPPGYMNERVQTSDWEGKETIGEFLYGSNWPEVSMMLTYLEIPSIYISKEGNVTCFDHCTAVLTKEDGNSKLVIENPTEYDTSFTIYQDLGEPLKHNYFFRLQSEEVKRGERKQIDL